MKLKCSILTAIVWTNAALAADKPPIYIWFEPEWFEGVEGSFGYYNGPGSYKATGSWGIAGPGVSAEWSTGGESEWNSMGAPPNETKAECHRDFVVPRAGKYKVWVRYYDHRNKTEPFRVTIQQGGKTPLSAELGRQAVVPPNDEFELYWGFSFGWGGVEGSLDAGPALLNLAIEKPGEAWRQVDAVLITDDFGYTPFGREKPPFAYNDAVGVQPKNGAEWRGSAKESAVGANWQRPLVGGRDFSMWTGTGDDPKWWGEQNIAALTPYDVFFHFSPAQDIVKQFHEQFASRKDLPIMAWPNLVPGFYLATPDLSPDKPLRQWLERTKIAFYIMTNYANPAYNDTNGPSTYAALTGPLADQFLGYIHGEAIGPPGLTMADKPIGQNRREHVDAVGKQLLANEAELWSKIYKTTVPATFWSKGISCLSVDSIALCHLFMEMGAKTVAYEEDSTNVHVPMRIAFMRGAARQYGGTWLNYASSNFGDACNYFTQDPITPRGAKSWYVNKYAITDGPSMVWYRKLYYLNYLSGASAIFWEQGLGNQWMLTGPGTHPIDLSPFGRATVDFQSFVDRLPDRGEPYTPIAILLSYGHSYDRVNYRCKMLNVFTENKNDLELRELFNVCWYPSGVVEGQPQAPDVQSMPNGTYGNIFDVLVDRPARAKAIFDYPVVVAAGDADLGAIQAVVEEYVKKGGTLVVNVAVSKGLSQKLLGLKLTGKTSVANEWTPANGASRPATPFEVAGSELDGAEAVATAGAKLPLITRNKVGAGSVILTLVPHMIGQDERAHPAVPWLMNGLTENLLPVEVRLINGDRPRGEIMYQINKTKDGWLVMLVNNHGVDKTQSGIARVDRTQFVDVVLRTTLPVKSAKEYTQPRELKLAKSNTGVEVSLRVHPGDVQVVALQVP